MRIYVIRHGETQGNKDHIMQGVIDIPLNDFGVMLAQITGDNMKDIKFDACYSSSLDRAYKTAKTILDRSGNSNVDIQIDDRIKEIDLGDFEGKCFSPSNLEVPLIKILLFKKNPFISGRFKNGESVYDVCKRTQQFLNELKTKNYENVLVSTHGCAMRAMLNRLYPNRFNFWQGMIPYNCAVNIVEVNDGKLKLIEKDKVYYDSKYLRDNYKLR